MVSSTQFCFFLLKFLLVQRCFGIENTPGIFFQSILDPENREYENQVIHSRIFGCAKKENCRYVVKTANSKTFTVENENDVKKIKNATEIWKKHDKMAATPLVFSDCKDAYDAGIRKNGQIAIILADGSSHSVFCDMTTDGGGWTVFQRRKSSALDFQRNWRDYKHGFGNLTENFWLGLDVVSYLTTKGNVTLRVDLKLPGEQGFAKYSDFKIANEHESYKINLKYISGTIGDSMSANNGAKFTTSDKDNDNVTIHNMAVFTSGPWWHVENFQSNLNSEYTKFSGVSLFAMSWKTWKGIFGGGISFSEMKFRREE